MKDRNKKSLQTQKIIYLFSFPENWAQRDCRDVSEKTDHFPNVPKKYNVSVGLKKSEDFIPSKRKNPPKLNCKKAKNEGGEKWGEPCKKERISR